MYLGYICRESTLHYVLLPWVRIQVELVLLLGPLHFVWPFDSVPGTNANFFFSVTD